MYPKSKLMFACLIGAFCIYLSACNTNPNTNVANELSEKVEVHWTWKRTVSNTDNVVYGTIKNKTDQPFDQVELEFRTQDSSGEPVHIHTFTIEKLGANAQKPFTQTYPAQATKEDSGFVTVTKVMPAN